MVESFEKNEFGNDCPFIDPQILSRIRFQQTSEKKNWQGVNVQHTGIPGTVTLNFKENPLTFSQERDSIEATEKVLYMFRQIHEAILQVNMNPLKNPPQNMKDEDWIYTNENFIQFKFFELIKGLSNGQFVYDDNLIKKINQAANAPRTSDISILPPKQIPQLYKLLKCESRIVKFLFELNGLQNTERHDWNALWTHTTGKSYFYERLNQHQKLNHFPMSVELTRKDRLAINVQRMQNKFSKQYFNFIPETFVIPDDYAAFCEYFKKVDAKLKSQVLTSSGQMQVSGHRPLRHNMWIVKPSNASRGIGIYLAKSIEEVSRHEPSVVCRYIDNPLLLYGHKFDLRLYVVVTSFDPLRVYIYREGLVRFASAKYSNDDTQTEESKFNYLTNYSINKKNMNYVQNENADDDTSGFKWSLSALQVQLEKEGVDVNLLWAKTYDIIIKSLLSIEEPTKAAIKKSNIHRNNCFELFGYDVMIDSNLTPWLLEVNLSPSLNFESPLDLKIKANLIKDTFTLVGVRKPINETTPVSNEYFSNSGEIQDREQIARRLNGKVPAKTTKDTQSERIDAVTSEIYAQIRKSELNWVQREYLSSFTQLGSKAKEILIESLLENQRRTNFVRIFPTKNSDFYDCFISSNRQMQQILYSFLYQEAFVSFKDVKNSNKIFGLEQYFARYGAAKERVEKKKSVKQEQQPMTNLARHKKKQEEWMAQEKEAKLVLEQKVIARELLSEYLYRICKLFLATSMIHGPQIQHIRDQTHALCNVQLLENEDYPQESSDSGGDTNRSTDPPKQPLKNVDNAKVVRKLQRKLIQINGGNQSQMKSVKIDSATAVIDELRQKTRIAQEPQNKKQKQTENKVSTSRLLSQYQNSFLTNHIQKHAKKFVDTKELLFFPCESEEPAQSFLEHLIKLQQKVEQMNLRLRDTLKEDDVFSFKLGQSFPQIPKAEKLPLRRQSSRGASSRAKSNTFYKISQEPQLTHKNSDSKPPFIRRSQRKEDHPRLQPAISASATPQIPSRGFSLDPINRQNVLQMLENKQFRKIKVSSRHKLAENPNEPSDENLTKQEKKTKRHRLAGSRVNSTTAFESNDGKVSQTMSLNTDSNYKFGNVNFSTKNRSSAKNSLKNSGAVAYLTKAQQAQLKVQTQLGIPFEDAFKQINKGLISDDSRSNLRKSPKRKLSPISVSPMSRNSKQDKQSFVKRSKVLSQSFLQFQK